MTQTDFIGFIGVAILLFAYFLNVTEKITKNSLAYLLMNFIGAGIACFASILMNYLPFIILEGSWTIVSVFGLIKFRNKK